MMQLNIAVFAVLVAVMLGMVIVIIVQTNEINRQKCKIGCEKYKQEEETLWLDKLKRLVWWFKKNWSLFVIYTIASSFIFLFLLTLIFPAHDMLNTMNGWVSLILGFIAVFMSVASMVLSFYNVEQSHASELRAEKTNKDIGQKLEKLEELKALLDLSVNEIKGARRDIEEFRSESQEKVGVKFGSHGEHIPDNDWGNNTQSNIWSQIKVVEANSDHPGKEEK